MSGGGRAILRPLFRKTHHDGAVLVVRAPPPPPRDVEWRRRRLTTWTTTTTMASSNFSNSKSTTVVRCFDGADAATPTFPFSACLVGERLGKENVRVILGSKSATRRQIASEMKIEHETMSADIDEKAIRFDDPGKLVEALAKAKAEAILKRLSKEEKKTEEKKRTLLITCDQVVVFDGKIREKPETEEEARMFMRSYKENNPCSTVGSIRVTDVETGKSASSVDVCTIHFKEISEEAMDFLIEEGEVMWCAGGLMVEHEKVRPFVTKIDGSEDGVMGMDKAVCARLINEVL